MKKEIPNLKEISYILKKIELQEKETSDTLHLTANENIVSKTVSHFLSSNLSGRYHVATYDDSPDLLNSISHNIRDGLVLRCLSSVFQLEKEARYFANQMFSSAFCDFRALSGLHGVFATLTTITSPNDIVYSFSERSISHYATKHLLKSIGRQHLEIPWDSTSCNIDLDVFNKEFKKNPSKHIFFDIGTPVFPLPIREIREIVGNDVMLIYDASHVLGLISGGKYQKPLEEGCDILIGNTHKTFPGPVKGVILYKNEEVGRSNSINIFDVAVSSQHTHHSICLYLTILEMAMFGEEYASQIIKNKNSLSDSLKKRGFEIFAPNGIYPESHMVAIIAPFKENNHKSADILFRNNINSNSRKICGFDSLRLGVQEVTRLGMKESEMTQIANFFEDSLINGRNIRDEVIDFVRNYKSVKYSFDEILGDSNT